MTLGFAQLPAPDSLLRRLDPRWKLAALLPAALVAALLHTLPCALVAFAVALGLVLLGRLPPRWYLVRVGSLSLFLLFFVVWLPFLHDGGPTWTLGALVLSRDGLVLAAVIVLKSLAAVTVILVVWATAPLDVNLKAAHALHVPGIIIHIVLLTYRYLFLLAEELGRLRIALRVRGYRNRANLHSYRTIGHVTGTLLVRSYERAERVGQAMRCRGFDGRFRSLAAFHTRGRDVAAFLIIILGASALLAGDLALP